MIQLELSSAAVLYDAVDKGNAQQVKRMLLCGTKPDDYTKYNKMNALHVAAVKGDTSCLRLLLEAGGSVTKRDVGGATPLHSAVLAGHLAVVKLLVEYGAKRSLGMVCGTDKKTPLEIAHSEGHDDIVRFLRNVDIGIVACHLCIILSALLIIRSPSCWHHFQSDDFVKIYCNYIYIYIYFRFCIHILIIFCLYMVSSCSSC